MHDLMSHLRVDLLPDGIKYRGWQHALAHSLSKTCQTSSLLKLTAVLEVTHADHNVLTVSKQPSCKRGLNAIKVIGQTFSLQRDRHSKRELRGMYACMSRIDLT